MYCKWCGMESDREDKCSWCGKALSAPKSGPSPDDNASSEPAVFDDAEEQLSEVMLPKEAANKPAPEPETESAPEEKAPFHPARPITYAERVEQYVSIMLVLIAGGMLVTHYYSDAWLNQFYPLLFIAGLLMGLFGVVPEYEQRTLIELGIAVGIAVLVGPLYALILYWLYSSIKGKVNPAVIGIVASYVVIRLAIGSATHGLVDTLTYIVLPNLTTSIASHLFEIVPLAVISGGWMVSRFGRMILNELQEGEEEPEPPNPDEEEPNLLEGV